MNFILLTEANNKFLDNKKLATKNTLAISKVIQRLFKQLKLKIKTNPL